MPETNQPSVTAEPLSWAGSDHPKPKGLGLVDWLKTTRDRRYFVHRTYSAGGWDSASYDYSIVRADGARVSGAYRTLREVRAAIQADRAKAV